MHVLNLERNVSILKRFRIRNTYMHFNLFIYLFNVYLCIMRAFLRVTKGQCRHRFLH